MTKKITYLITCLLIIYNSAFSQHIAEIQNNIETEFGLYPCYKVDIQPSVETYTVAADFSNVKNYNDFTFSNKSLDLLRRNGFVVTFSPYKQIHDLYSAAQSENKPVFVTSDALLHTFHILFDYVLRMLEVNTFETEVKRLTEQMIAKTDEYYSAVSDSALKDACVRNVAYFSVAKKLLFGSLVNTPEYVDDLVAAELELIDAHKGKDLSPVFWYYEDYSQYVPRGHYTKNETLKTYFKGMMWYGRMMFRLYPDTTDVQNVFGKRETTQAIMIIKALKELQDSGSGAIDLWNRIYTPTVFFVGKTDDLDFNDYLPLIETVYGKPVENLAVSEITDETKLEAFIDEAMQLRNPAINSSFVYEWEDFQIVTKGYRFMGQRYIPDSYMFTNLVHKFVWGRLFPKGLDAMTVLGSERAYSIMKNLYKAQKNYPDWQPQIEKLRSEFFSLQSEAWVQNLYWNWLYVLVSLMAETGEGYPAFMQNQAWQDKNLNTALASWAELRHDTILYAKQSYTFERGMSPVTEVIKGYVEPNPEFFSRVASLVDLMINGFNSLNIMLPEFEKKLTDLKNISLKLKVIAEKELTNQEISNDEYRLIYVIGEILENLVTFPPEVAGQIENDTDKEMAVIADVHTDINNRSVLEEGVGYPMKINVICPIRGELVMTEGAVFSYYEFTHPMNDRLTDEKWQEILKSENPKDLPEWTDSFVDNTTRTNEIGTMQCKSYVTGIERDNEITPENFILHQNYPNPFNPSTVINYQVSAACRVKIEVYNILGQKVKTLVNQDMQPGVYEVRWEGKDENENPVSSGVYFYRLMTRDIVITRKMIVIR